MRLSLYLAGLFVFTLACTDDKGPEEELVEDGKDDSQRRPTNHGAIGFGVPATSELTAEARYHAWTFELTDDAEVDLTTSYAVLGQRRVDTVLYLYKEGPPGWGSYIARNDDYGTTIYSQLVRTLHAGRYRALVKGYTVDTLGRFKLTVNCAGAGCAPPPSCVFGSTYGDIAMNPALQIVNANVITAATLSTLSAQDQQHLVDAVKESSHTDVTTPLEAIGRVDQGEVNVTWIAEPDARRMFVAFEYGAGDNSYGAIFARTDGAMVTSIHDGDLYGCTTTHEQCLLPEDWTALRNDPSFTATSTRVITAESQLTGIARDQALAALRRVYPMVTTITQGLAQADDHRLNVVAFTHANGVKVDVFELGAGDTSVGTIYLAGTLKRAATIDDLFIGNCSLFVP